MRRVVASIGFLLLTLPVALQAGTDSSVSHTLPEPGLALELPAVWQELPAPMLTLLEEFGSHRISKSGIQKFHLVSAYLRGDLVGSNPLEGPALFAISAPDLRNADQIFTTGRILTDVAYGVLRSRFREYYSEIGPWHSGYDDAIGLGYATLDLRTNKGGTLVVRAYGALTKKGSVLFISLISKDRADATSEVAHALRTLQIPKDIAVDEEELRKLKEGALKLKPPDPAAAYTASLTAGLNAEQGRNFAVAAELFQKAADEAKALLDQKAGNVEDLQIRHCEALAKAAYMLFLLGSKDPRAETDSAAALQLWETAIKSPDCEARWWEAGRKALVARADVLRHPRIGESLELRLRFIQHLLSQRENPTISPWLDSALSPQWKLAAYDARELKQDENALRYAGEAVKCARIAIVAMPGIPARHKELAEQLRCQAQCLETSGQIPESFAAFRESTNLFKALGMERCV